MKATVRRLDPQIIVYLAKQNKVQGKSRSAKCRTRFMQWPVLRNLNEHRAEQLKSLINLKIENYGKIKWNEKRTKYNRK